MSVKQPDFRWIPGLLRSLAAATAAGYLVVFLVLALIRMRYPFALEWLESCSLDHVERILAGRPIYVAPSLEFIPFIYPPLYFYAAALVAKIAGAGFLALRLTSIISSAVCFGVIFFWVKRETGRRWPALIASGLFAATYQVSGDWLDLARNDSLFLALTLAALYLVRFGRSPTSAAAAGALLALAFLTKQAALVIALPIVLYLLMFERRRAAWFIATVVALVGGSTWLLNARSGGWYDFYVFTLPSRQPIVPERWFTFWRDDLLRPYSVALLAACVFLTLQCLRRSRAGWYYLFMAGAMVGTSWFSRVHVGCHENTVLPAYAALAILMGLAVDEALESIAARGEAGRRGVLAGFVYLAVLLQLGALIYNPRSQLPTAADRAAGEKLVARIAAIDGDVFIPAEGYLARMAGKPACAHLIEIVDLIVHNQGPAREKIREEILDAIRRRKFAAIMLMNRKPWFPDFDRTLDENYDWAGSLFDADDVFWPISGMRTRPENLHLRKGNH